MVFVFNFARAKTLMKVPSTKDRFYLNNLSITMYALHLTDVN